MNGKRISLGSWAVIVAIALILVVKLFHVHVPW